MNDNYSIITIFLYPCIIVMINYVAEASLKYFARKYDATEDDLYNYIHHTGYYRSLFFYFKSKNFFTVDRENLRGQYIVRMVWILISIAFFCAILSIVEGKYGFFLVYYLIAIAIYIYGFLISWRLGKNLDKYVKK